jgi:hypothetical protein
MSAVFSIVDKVWCTCLVTALVSLWYSTFSIIVIFHGNWSFSKYTLRYFLLLSIVITYILFPVNFSIVAIMSRTALGVIFF